MISQGTSNKITIDQDLNIYALISRENMTVFFIHQYLKKKRSRHTNTIIEHKIHKFIEVHYENRFDLLNNL